MALNLTYMNPDSTYGVEWANPPVNVLVPVTGATVQLSGSDRHVLLRPTAGIAALTIRLPRSPDDWAFLDVTFAQAVTALTWQDAAGNAVSGMLAAGTAGTGTTLRYIRFPDGSRSWVKWR